MKLALLSDIHGNILALDACLEHAQAQGATQIALLGDLVGYGVDPVAVVKRAQDLYAKGAWLVKGNHDAMAVRPPVTSTNLGDSSAAWMHARLNAEQLDFLDQLPLQHQHDNILLVHASANQPEQWRYVVDERSAGASLDAACEIAGIRYVFGGHVHQQTLYYRGAGQGLMQFKPTAGVAVPVPKHRHWLATIGSVGQPRDGHTHAMYAIFDADKFQLTFHRVAYDHHAAAAAIRATDLSPFFADRLETGK